jgi:hypothetical protein
LPVAVHCASQCIVPGLQKKPAGHALAAEFGSHIWLHAIGGGV